MPIDKGKYSRFLENVAHRILISHRASINRQSIATAPSGDG